MFPRTAGTAERRAVSPVLGVVLMVAITVILATVAATALHDTVTTAGPEAPASAAVSVDDGDGLSVTWLADSRSEKLRVEFATDDERAKVYLRRVGASVALDTDGFETVGASVVRGEDMTVDRGDEVAVTVTAVRGEQRTQIDRWTATI